MLNFYHGYPTCRPKFPHRLCAHGPPRQNHQHGRQHYTKPSNAASCITSSPPPPTHPPLIPPINHVQLDEVISSLRPGIGHSWSWELGVGVGCRVHSLPRPMYLCSCVCDLVDVVREARLNTHTLQILVDAGYVPVDFPANVNWVIHHNRGLTF